MMPQHIDKIKKKYKNPCRGSRLISKINLITSYLNCSDSIIQCHDVNIAFILSHHILTGSHLFVHNFTIRRSSQLNSKWSKTKQKNTGKTVITDRIGLDRIGTENRRTHLSYEDNSSYWHQQVHQHDINQNRIVQTEK